MGLNFAMELSTLESMSIEGQIGIHLSSNFYPPVPSSMIQPCIEAINAYNNEDYTREIAMPRGVLYRGEDYAPVHAIIENHRLDPWLVIED